MSQILVRNLSPETVERLKKRARDNNRSLEAEVREILVTAALRLPLEGRAKSPEFQKFEEDIAGGRNRNEAFAAYSRAVVAKRPVDPVDSIDDIRAGREEREARFD